MPSEFEPIFKRLRGILQKNTGALHVTVDSPTAYWLETGPHPKLKRKIPVGWTVINTNYVSYHLMPVYAHPPLLQGLSPELKARMQGKACFNFKTIDEALFEELDTLTARGFRLFNKAGYTG